MSHSEYYKQQLLQKHAEKPSWGSTGAKRIGQALITYLRMRTDIRTVLDYGCGNAKLGQFMRDNFKDRRITWHNYDPGMPQYATYPPPCHLVLSTDVLEHVEPDYLDATLKELSDLSEIAQFHWIASTPASQTLPDGRNVHLIVEGLDFWMDAFQKGQPDFDVMKACDVRTKSRGLYNKAVQIESERVRKKL